MTRLIVVGITAWLGLGVAFCAAYTCIRDAVQRASEQRIEQLVRDAFDGIGR